MDTQKLRQRILDLAIRGKLVPQDPNDEPASVLLKRIRAEKERLIAEGKIKRPKAKKSTDKYHYQNFTPPFDIPASWQWVRIADISSDILYGVSESAKTEGSYKLLRITDIQNSGVNWDSVPYTEYDPNKVKQFLLQNGDLLFARTGATVGKSYLVEDVPTNAIYASYLIRIRTVREVLPEYLKLFFESGFYWTQITLGSVGIGQPNVNGTSLGQLILPIPPRSEQIRILSATSRILNTISDISASSHYLLDLISVAKSKILDLAMQGKLIPQDPADEPAADMLRRVHPKAKIITDNPHYPQLPDNWVLAKIKDVFEINPKNKISDDSDAGFVPMASIQDGYSDKFHYDVKKWGEIKAGFTHFADGDIAVAKISPCLENRKSMILRDLPNGIGAGTTELLVFRSSILIPEFSLLFFKSDNFIKCCTGTFNGVVGQQRVGKSIVEDIHIPIPPLNTQRTIVQRVQEWFNCLDNILVSISNERDSLI